MIPFCNYGNLLHQYNSFYRILFILKPVMQRPAYDESLEHKLATTGGKQCWVKAGLEPAESIYQAERMSCRGASGKPDPRGCVVQLLRSYSRNSKRTVSAYKKGFSHLQGSTGSMCCILTGLNVATWSLVTSRYDVKNGDYPVQNVKSAQKPPLFTKITFVFIWYKLIRTVAINVQWLY